VLSAEIIVISLGVVSSQPFATQAMVLTAVAALMTVGVYGLVACIVKLDDLGLYLSRKGMALGRAILWAAPFLMKTLSVVGTAAMFLVGGQILVHGIPPVHHWIEHLVEPWSGWGKVVMTLFDGVFGMVAGGIVLLLLKPFLKKEH
jgi:predicted DNA repair protein MutK